MAQDAKPPIKEFRSRGGIKAAIWENQVQQGDRIVVLYSIKIQRSYMDKATGEWKTTDYFRLEDLPRVMLVASEAYRFISLKGSDAPDAVEE